MADTPTNTLDIPSDTISRRAAIDALERKQSHVERPITETRWFDLGLKKAQEVLSELPSAQRKGKWKFEKMKHIINGEVRDVMICSVCDAGWFRYDISDNTVRCVPNYCPNCGAEMDISEG